MKISRPAGASRRSFIKAAAVGVGGSVAGTQLLVSHAHAQTPSSLTQEPELANNQGYRETAHVREYYQKARF